MSQYEDWNNRETFMVASIIDNDRAFLKYIMEEVERYMVNGMEGKIPDKLAMMVIRIVTIPVELRERENKDFLLVRIRFKATILATILQAFYEEVDWNELAEHYKAKYVENLINDKDVLDEIAKGKDSKYHSEPNLNPEFKDPIMDIMESIDDKPSA